MGKFVPESKRKVRVLYTKARDGSVPVGQAFLDAAQANGQSRGCIISIIAPTGEIDTRIFGHVKKQEVAWVGTQLVHAMINEE